LAESAKWVACGPAWGCSTAVTAHGAKYPKERTLRIPHAGLSTFRTRSAASRSARPRGSRRSACRKSARHQSGRLRSGRLRLRVAPLRARGDRLQTARSEGCAATAEGRQFEWPWPPTPRNVVPVYSCSGWSGMCDFQLSAFSSGKCWGHGGGSHSGREAIDKGHQCCNFREPLCVRLPPFLQSITELTIDQEQATRSQTATVLNLVSAQPRRAPMRIVGIH
jgi:hypothetical protein